MCGGSEKGVNGVRYMVVGSKGLGCASPEEALLVSAVSCAWIISAVVRRLPAA